MARLTNLLVLTRTDDCCLEMVLFNLLAGFPPYRFKNLAK